MKALKLAIIALSGIATVSAQDMNPNDVPSDVKNTFKQSYPDATDVEWEMEGDAYKVEFDIDREDQEIWYGADGKMNKMEKDLKEGELPEAITSTISNYYADYKIDSIEVTEENESTTYEVELEKGWDDEKKVVFDVDGKVLSERND